MNTNIFNPYVRKELELYHHGIQGQKWGKRNGPPYPLSASDYSSAEKKAMNYSSKLNSLAERNDEIAKYAIKNAVKGDKIHAKLKKKRPGSKKANILNEKYEFYKTTVDKALKEKENIDKEIERISDQLVEEGFTLYRANGSDSVRVGRNIALQIFTYGLFGSGYDVPFDTSRFAVDFKPEDIAEAKQNRNERSSKKEKAETTSEKIGRHDVEWDEDTGEIKSVKDEKGNKASFDDVLEEQERKENKSKSEKKPRVSIPSENSSIMKRMRAKIEKGGLDSLTDSDWDALGWSEDIVGTDEEIELLNNLHVWEYY